MRVITPSDEYHKHIKSATKHTELSNDDSGFPIFSSPVYVYSNVKNGLGIFAGYNTFNYDISLD